MEPEINQVWYQTPALDTKRSNVAGEHVQLYQRSHLMK